MTPKEFAQFNDAMEQVLDLVRSYKAKLEKEGLAAPAIDQMVADFHSMLMRSVPGAQK